MNPVRPSGKVIYRSLIGYRKRSNGMKSVFISLFLIFLVLQPFAFSSEGKWTGVDETVVERYAKEQGREAREPLINTDQGDLLLFVFLVAGAVGGFIGGYYWRVLVTSPNNRGSKGSKES